MAYNVSHLGINYNIFMEKDWGKYYQYIWDIWLHKIWEGENYLYILTYSKPHNNLDWSF